MLKISPSILACDFSRMGEELKAIEQAGAHMAHLDIMDGHFVPNITIGPAVVKGLRKCCGLPFDVHLMLTEPHKYIDAFADAGADIITFHAECSSDIEKTLGLIKRRGIKAGLVLKPATPPEALLPFIKKLDMLLVMTVEPGFGGQSFMPDMLPKIKKLREYCGKAGLNPDIQVDGGIDRATAPRVTDAGANVLVAGSYVFGSGDYKAAISSLLAPV